VAVVLIPVSDLEKLPLDSRPSLVKLGTGYRSLGTPFDLRDWLPSQLQVACHEREGKALNRAGFPRVEWWRWRVSNPRPAAYEKH